MNIVTEYVYPPIPDRSMDWSAIDRDTYDGAEDSHCPVGRGPTERAAINSLVEQLVDEAAEAPPSRVEAESLARRFHETYERLAPQFGYETRAETRAFDPDSPNGRLMVAVCREVAPAGAGHREALTAELDDVIDALDRALGDSDITHIESDDELREDHPVQWACAKLVGLRDRMTCEEPLDAKPTVAELEAILQPGNPKPVGRCATTQTERYRVEGCDCATYPGNEGLPCLTWCQSRAADRCAYCDHNLDCHRRLSAMFKNDASTEER